MLHFDPNAAASDDSGIFGLPFTEKDASLVFLPVPWEATTSYGGGTSSGPSAILNASKQVDLFDLDVLKPYESGIYCLPESEAIQALNTKAKELVTQLSEMAPNSPKAEAARTTINEYGEQLNTFVYQETKRILAQGKIAAVIGGDHSVPFGALRAVAEKHPSFGVLHFDAHSDTRDAYGGLTWSHASIMRNVLDRIPAVTRLTQVGIRDVCEEEVQYTANRANRVSVFYDRHLSRKKMEGTSWAKLCETIVATLPQEVWVSFDIDGLDPRFCPHTGTPVPGGLDFHEANYLIGKVVESGRTLVGFDLNEVAPNLENPEDEWDANVGARLLYKLTAWTLASQGKAKVQTS